MLRVSRLAIVGFALAILGSFITQASAQQSLRVATFGGAWADVIQKYTIPRFTKLTGMKVELVLGQPSDFFAQLVASRGRKAPFDVLFLDDSLQEEAIRSGVLRKLDPAEVPNLKNLYDTALNKDGYGPAMVFLSVGMLYNKTKFQEAGIPEPTSWNDLWNPKLAGKISIPSLNIITGRGLLLKIARMAGDESNFNKALDRLSELKLRSVYESAAAVMPQLAAGDVWVIPMTNGRSWAAIESGAPFGYVVPKEGEVFSVDTIDVAVGTSFPKESQQFINLILDPIAQLGMAVDLYYAPTNKLLAPAIDAYPEFAKKMPSSQAKVEVPNWSIYNKNRREILDGWNRRVLH